MRPTTLAVLAVAALGLGLSLPPATSQPAPAARRTVLSPLKAGQAVTLREKGSLWEINVLQDVAEATHKVAEIGDDFIVVTDNEGLLETRIPLTAIRAVTVIKTKPK
ncbi:MAG TPA: hypothetical protein VFG68_10940 [Fimbriiglobus sp.]|nr:hypothetical protein [Fimbriiglobus sp.]